MTCYGKVNFAPAENIGFEHKEKVGVAYAVPNFSGGFPHFLRSSMHADY